MRSRTRGACCTPPPRIRGTICSIGPNAAAGRGWYGSIPRSTAINLPASSTWPAGSNCAARATRGGAWSCRTTPRCSDRLDSRPSPSAASRSLKPRAGDGLAGERRGVSAWGPARLPGPQPTRRPPSRHRRPRDPASCRPTTLRGRQPRSCPPRSRGPTFCRCSRAPRQWPTRPRPRNPRRSRSTRCLPGGPDHATPRADCRVYPPRITPSTRSPGGGTRGSSTRSRPRRTAPALHS